MIGMQDRLQRFHMNVNQEIGLNWKAFQLAIVPEIAISPSSSLELVLGPKGNGVTKSSLLLQLDHCSTRWVTSSGLPGKLLFFFQELVGGMDT